MHAVHGFAPLPRPNTQSGEPRRTGVEVEFSGLTMEDTCRTITDHLGGDVVAQDAFLVSIKDTEIGTITVELDTPARHASDNRLVKKGLEIAQAVVPLEIISEPLELSGLETFNTVIGVLRRAGAAGSRSGALLGFGVHLNPEAVDPNGAFTVATLRAYALLEPYLRHIEDLDLTRRALPFVQPWPDAFVSDLVASPATSLSDLFPLMAGHLTTRNHGLDVFPLLKHVDEARFAASFPDDKTSARPTFHFRLPDCRIDEPDWDLTQPWALWHLVETVADTPDLLNDLSTAWSERRARFWRSDDWITDVAALLEKHNLGEAA
ncbi:amidoligase family protein [Marivita sp. S6314]|uniref:amidoligase family protein n=1 Tax=Marivita sp. S6314 TaxID=2926406 RepID=UPI001FF614D5|nr:amidoligase family protein [Marivita sp. S6314]MCK0149506.1 amidoligase family protein [Marivita sp. S6314]